jgi:membrane protease YdiL (CAAX protease family)
MSDYGLRPNPTYGLPSRVFGFFRDRTGRLVAPIVLHIFYNAGFLLLFTTPG